MDFSRWRNSIWNFFVYILFVWGIFQYVRFQIQDKISRWNFSECMTFISPQVLLFNLFIILHCAKRFLLASKLFKVVMDIVTVFAWMLWLIALFSVDSHYHMLKVAWNSLLNSFSALNMLCWMFITYFNDGYSEKALLEYESRWIWGLIFLIHITVNFSCMIKNSCSSGRNFIKAQPGWIISMKNALRVPYWRTQSFLYLYSCNECFFWCTKQWLITVILAGIYACCILWVQLLGTYMPTIPWRLNNDQKTGALVRHIHCILTHKRY